MSTLTPTDRTFNTPTDEQHHLPVFIAPDPIEQEGWSE